MAQNWPILKICWSELFEIQFILSPQVHLKVTLLPIQYDRLGGKGSYAITR